MKEQTNDQGIQTSRFRKDLPGILLSVFFTWCGFLNPLHAGSWNETTAVATPDNLKMTTVAPQQTEVEGTVNDSDGVPLPGANVVVKGTTRGVVTDFDGNFSIEAEIGDTLEISYIGFKPIEVLVENLDGLSVSLESDAEALDEVVVVGYGTQKKTDLTGAIATVKEEDFAPGTNTNAVQLLTGAAAGVNVSQTSSAPGGGIRVQIRGAGSINSSNGVLFVVDGLPGVSPNSLSPQDIESIEVLKDASASAIYGTRAANGVVLITTKRGKKGESTLSYSTYAGMQEITKQLDVLGAEDYMRLINLRNDPEVYSAGEIAAAGQGTDWQNEIFRSAPIQNHQLSMSGGSENGDYYVGLNYFGQDGIVENSSNKKYNARVNITSRPFERLTIATNFNYTRELTKEILTTNGENTNAGPINSAIQYDPTLPASINPETGRYYRNPGISLENPVGLIKGIDEQNLSNRFYGSLNADYEVVENLTATLRLGVESNNNRRDFYRSRITDRGLANGGDASINTGEFTHFLTEYLLKYENIFNEKHNFSVLGGATFEKFTDRGFNGSSAGFLSDVTGSDLLQSGDGEFRDNVSSGKDVNQLNGFLGRMTYGFNDKYLLTASFRVDGSSRFSEENKYAFFPSGSLGWRIDQEGFMENLDFINQLKLRAGYGELGNQGINNFETRQTLVAGGNSVFGGQIFQGVVPARLPNPDLRWETTKEVNIGLDFGFLNNRISGSVDYFDRSTSDQLFNKPLPSVVGFTGVRVNLGEVVNKGFDFSLNTNNFVGDFSWDTRATLSILKNEVTELPDFTQQIISGGVGAFISGFNLTRVGDPLRSYFGYEIDGIFQEGDDIANSPTPNVNGYAPGMPRFVDQNGDGVITDDDRVVLGDAFPDVSFGINNRLKWKNLSLDFYFVGVQGVETLDGNVTESLYPTNDARNSISRYFLNRWTPENPSNELPSAVNPNLYGGGLAVNSLTIVDASYVRLRNITLGYNIPVGDKSVLSSLRIYGAVDNLVTITDYEGYNPDASDIGGGGVARANYNSYPLARTVRVGFDVQF